MLQCNAEECLKLLFTVIVSTNTENELFLIAYIMKNDLGDADVAQQSVLTKHL